LTVDDIAKIEQTLEIKLPEELKQKYLSSELDEVDDIETLGLDDYLNKPEELKNVLIRDPSKLIKLNLRLRKNGLFKRPFHPCHFAIGYEWKTDYYFIDLRDCPLKAYCAMNNKSWAYNPDDLSGNILCTPSPGLDTFLESNVLKYVEGAKKRKTDEEAGIPEREYTAEETYAFLQGIKDRIPKENWSDGE
jgi:hypothetical protein